MGEILGIGATHYPGLIRPDDDLRKGFKRFIAAPRMSPKWKDPKNWPAELVAEIGDDDGLTSAKRYHERMWDNFRKLRKTIDDFAPDFIVIFADDQYENFRETIIPPFCVYGLDNDFDQQIWNHGMNAKIPNYWGEPHDWTLRIHGHRDGAKYLTTGLLNRGIPMPYAYKTLHDPILAHGFNYTILYLDCDRKGFPHPVVPFHVNCYGSAVISAGGASAHLYKDTSSEGLPDPPGPNPAMCYEVGAKVAQTLAESPYRAVIMASSSWSHSFLSKNTDYAVPDRESDRMMFEALKAGDYEKWRRRTIQEVENAGHHEMLNWHVLVGAMGELKRKPIIQDYVETWIFQSDKCFAVFPPS